MMQPTDPQPSFPPAMPPSTPLPPGDTPPVKKVNPVWYNLRGLGSFVGFVLSVILLATLINLFIFQSYYVDGTSMTPTLQPDERLIINKMPRTWARLTRDPYIPGRGEIVVLDSSLIGVNGRHEQLIKRVIGLPGERVIVQDGTLTVYNDTYPEGFNPDTQELNLVLSPTDGEVDIVVPDNHVFVAGDNRGPGGSYDSRSDLGTIPAEQLVGELAVRLVPIDRAKVF